MPFTCITFQQKRAHFPFIRMFNTSGIVLELLTSKIPFHATGSSPLLMTGAIFPERRLSENRRKGSDNVRFRPLRCGPLEANGATYTSTHTFSSDSVCVQYRIKRSTRTSMLSTVALVCEYGFQERHRSSYHYYTHCSSVIHLMC